MKALITGGLGFVGRHLTKKLLDLDYHVTIIDNCTPGSGFLYIEYWQDYLLPNYKQYKKNLDIHDKKDCRIVFASSTEKYDVIFHLAAIVGGREMIENDPLSVAEDLEIDAMFFKWVAKVNPQAKIYYFSSSAAYPIWMQAERSQLPLSEQDTDLNTAEIGIPDMTYGWSKLTGEYLAKICHEKYGCDITVFRPFSGYGEDQHDSYPFPAILNRVINNPDGPITVWGSGKQVRDFIHIDDIVNGILLLGEKIHDASAINLSTGKGTSFNQLAQIMAYIIHGKPIEIINSTDKPEGVFYRVGSNSLQEQLGFKNINKLTLEEGISLSLKRLKYEPKSINSNSSLRP